MADPNEKTADDSLRATVGGREVSSYERDRGAMRATLTASITAMVVTAGVASFAIYQAGRPVAPQGAANIEAYATLASLMSQPPQRQAAVQAPAAREIAPRQEQAVAPSVPQPTVPAFPPQQSAAPQQPTPTGMQPQGVQQQAVSRIGAMLGQPDLAGPLMDKLSEAAAIHVPGEISGDRPVIAFIDPRCPYCHAAYEALDGKVDILWLPTLALGSPESGEPLLAGLLGQTEAVMENGEIAAVSLAEDAERADRLDTIMRGGEIDPGEITDAQRFAANDNLALAVELYRYHNEPLGVPTFIVPKPDGTAAFVRGWDDRQTMGEIISAYEAQGSEG